jgi:hypothetical protein
MIILGISDVKCAIKIWTIIVRTKIQNVKISDSILTAINENSILSWKQISTKMKREMHKQNKKKLDAEYFKNNKKTIYERRNKAKNLERH